MTTILVTPKFIVTDSLIVPSEQSTQPYYQNKIVTSDKGFSWVSLTGIHSNDPATIAAVETFIECLIQSNYIANDAVNNASMLAKALLIKNHRNERYYKMLDTKIAIVSDAIYIVTFDNGVVTVTLHEGNFLCGTGQPFMTNFLVYDQCRGIKLTLERAIELVGLTISCDGTSGGKINVVKLGEQ